MRLGVADPLEEAWEAAQQQPPPSHGYEPEQGTDPLRAAWQASQPKPPKVPAVGRGGRPVAAAPPIDSTPDPLHAAWQSAQRDAPVPDGSKVNALSDVAAQAFSGPANLVLTAGEGLARLGAGVSRAGKFASAALSGRDYTETPGRLDRVADSLRERRAAVNEVLEPETTAGKVANVVSNIGAQALPAIATGGTYGVMAGAGASAALTGVQSQAGRDASITGMVGDLTGNKTINRIADNPIARTATDMALDVGLSGASSKISDLIAARKARSTGVLDAIKGAKPSMTATEAVPEVVNAAAGAPMVQAAVERADSALRGPASTANASVLDIVSGRPGRPLTVPIEEPLGGVVGGRTPSELTLSPRQRRPVDPNSQENPRADTGRDLAASPVRQAEAETDPVLRVIRGAATPAAPGGKSRLVHRGAPVRANDFRAMEDDALGSYVDETLGTGDLANITKDTARAADLRDAIHEQALRTGETREDLVREVLSRRVAPHLSDDQADQYLQPQLRALREAGVLAAEEVKPATDDLVARVRQMSADLDDVDDGFDSTVRDREQYIDQSGLDRRMLAELDRDIQNGAREIHQAPAADLYSYIDTDLTGTDDVDLSGLREGAKELARRSGQSPLEIVATRARQILPPDLVDDRLESLANARAFDDAATKPPGVFETTDKHGKAFFWRDMQGNESPPRYMRPGDDEEDVLRAMYDEFEALPAAQRSALTAVEGGEIAVPGAVRGIRSATGKLPRNLTKFSEDDLMGEWVRLAELNAADEAGHASVMESGYRADYEELPRTEKLGRKGQEDLPDADGTIDAERLAGDNKVISGFRKTAMIRASREKTVARIEAELKRRGVDLRFGGATEGGVVPFSNPMMDPATLRRAFASRFGQSAATAGVGLGLRESEDEKLRATGTGLLGLAALHAVGAPAMRSGARFVGGRAVDALKGSETGQRLLNTISHDILADPNVKELIDAYDEAVAGARARAAELSKQAKALGPSGDRAVSDVIEGENFEPLTTDQTAAMAVAQRIADEFTALGQGKVAAGLLSAETVAKREGKYLPRMYAEHLGERVRTQPKSPVFASSPNRIRIKGETMRDDELTMEARNALGEIRESSFRTAHGIEKGYRDIAAAKLFDGLREIPDVIHPRFAEAVDALRAAKQSGNKAAIEAAEDAVSAFSSRFSHGAEGFRRLPDTPGMGVLRGAVVRADVADYLDGVDGFGAKAGVYGDLLTLWKRIKTTLNLPTHVGNVASNSVIAHMVGLPLWKQPVALKAAIADFDNYGASTKFLAEKGILSHGLPTASEGVPAAGRSLKSSLTQLSSTTRDQTKVVLALKGITPNAAPFRAVGKAASALEAAYAKEDAVYRIAVFNKLIGEGENPETAAALVDKAFVNYNTRSPALRAIKNTVSPFIMYPVRAIPFITEQIIEHPWRWMTLAATWGGLDQASRAHVGAIAQEDLRPGDRTNKAVGYLAPGFTQLPMKGRKGEKYGVDVSRFTPFSALTGSPTPGSATYAALGDRVPGILQPSGPVLDIGARLANVDPYTGERLVKPGDGPREKWGALAGGLSSLALPSMLSFHAPRLAGDIADKDPHRAVNDALAFVGMRPRKVTPGLQAFSEQRQFEEARAQILHDLRSALRSNKNPARAVALQREAENRLQELARQRRDSMK